MCSASRWESKHRAFVVLGTREGPALALGTHSDVHGRNADPARRMVGLTTDDLTTGCNRLQDAGVELVEDATHYGNVRVATGKDPEATCVQHLQFGRLP